METFCTTRWTVLSQIKDPDCPQMKELLDSLFQDYWKPVFCYIHRKVKNPEQAMDLTQAFFYEKVFRNQLFQKAEKEKGKFRSLLLTSLNNFLNSENRRIMALKRGQNKVICNPDFLENALLTGLRDHHSETDSFHFAWVASLLETVSQKVKEHYESNGNAVYWAVFDARLRQPCLMDSPAPSLKEICTQYSIEDEIKASTMISTVKRNFQKTLRNQVREYRCTDAGVDEELSELLDFLHKFVQD